MLVQIAFPLLDAHAWSLSQYAIDNNQTVEEIEEQLELVCDAIPSVGPTQSVFDCDKLNGLPDITFDFSDAEFTLSPDQYILRVRNTAILPHSPPIKEAQELAVLDIVRTGSRGGPAHPPDSIACKFWAVPGVRHCA